MKIEAIKIDDICSVVGDVLDALDEKYEALERAKLDYKNALNDGEQKLGQSLSELLEYDTEDVLIWASAIYWNARPYKSVIKKFLRAAGLSGEVMPIQTEYKCDLCGEVMLAGSWTALDDLKKMNPSITTKMHKSCREKRSRETMLAIRSIGRESIEYLRICPYNEYLRSKHWTELRDEIKRRDGYKCVRCGSNEKLHVHHLTYERRGEELHEDLETLCAVCHSKEHDV